MLIAARLAAAALIAASLPAPPAEASEGVLIASLCGGGVAAIPLGDQPKPAPLPCPLKACHAARCRRPFDRSQ